MSGIRTLDGFFDSLVQSFENCRAGLSDDAMTSSGAKEMLAEPLRFFTDLYEKEIPRLVDVIRLEEPHLTPAARQEYVNTVDDLVRKVLLPAYIRVAVRFTRRERNDFYLLAEPFHGLERAGWSLLGLLLGALAVAAPFIPLWEKAWMLPFLVVGFFVPDLRRLLLVRRYESELNGLVGRADREVLRIDTAYLTSTEALNERSGTESPAERIHPGTAQAQLNPQGDSSDRSPIK